MSSAVKVKSELKKLGSPEKKEILQRFFKTGKGEYGEGDIFLGIMVGDQRNVAKKHTELPIEEVKKLLQSKVHEHRLVALMILLEKYKKADEKGRKKIYDFYLKNTKYVNNWDLVDLSAHKIVGEYLVNKPRHTLYKLAKSSDLWERRISIVSTFAFIRDNEFEDSLKIAELLLNDKHDLIHKAVGWVLREVGKKDLAAEEKFLKKYHKVMPRTMLRYSIEKFDEKKRKFYMRK